MSESVSTPSAGCWRRALKRAMRLAVLTLTCLPRLHGQQVSGPVNTQSDQALQARVQVLEQEVAELQRLVKEMQAGHTANGIQASDTANNSKQSDYAAPQANDLKPEDRRTLDFMRDTTINLGLDMKEDTVTFDYRLFEGFLMRYEWHRDFSNQPSFLTDTQGLLTKAQSTATVGVIWWWGRKEGAW